MVNDQKRLTGLLRKEPVKFLREFRVSSSIRTAGCLLCVLLVVSVFSPIFLQEREIARSASCLGNVKQIQMSVLQYSLDWDETLPPASQWAALSNKYLLKPAASTTWHCPDSSSSFSYASNQAIGGKCITDMDDVAATIYLFESDATDWNACGGIERLPKRERHNDFGRPGFVYSLLDGHVKKYCQSTVIEAHWQPRLLPKVSKKK